MRIGWYFANRNRVLCQNCVRYPPETPVEHRDLRGHSDAHRCCGKSLMWGALVHLGCASARADGINFQACLIDRSSISPL
jgi:hypothetical protein